VISTPVEHRSVLQALEELRKSEAAEILYLSVDGAGRIDPADLHRHLIRGADLVCIMAANNEVGTVYPVEQIAAMAGDAKALLLVDATQAAGRMPLHAKDWGVDYLIFSGHKIYGPKGTGCLALGTGLQLAEQPAGTPNVPAIAGFGEACRLRVLEMTDDERRILRLRDRLQDLLQSKIPDLVVNGDTSARLNGNLNVSIPGALNDAVLSRLHDRVALSTGSACTSGAQSPSHVLVALGLEEELIDGALRIGVGKFTTDEEIECAAELISLAALEVREAIHGRAGAAAKG
jgi:cysteine desulfurase